MLQAKTKEQKEYIEHVLLRGVSVWLTANSDGEGLHIDDYVSFEELASVVDYLRKEDNARRKKARWAGMKSGIDGLWVSGDTIFLKGAKKEDAVGFIQSLGELGYNVNELMAEYNTIGKISI